MLENAPKLGAGFEVAAKNRSEYHTNDFSEDPLVKRKSPLPYYPTVYEIVGTEEHIASAFLLSHVIDIPPVQRTPEGAKRVGNIMRALGWAKSKTVRIGGAAMRGYVREMKPAGDDPAG
jgi:hypothetical protein